MVPKVTICRGTVMLSKQEIAKNFTLNMEKERLKRGLTQAQMAKKLEMSLSGYKKIISGSTTKIDLYTAQLLQAMTGKAILELIDQYEEDTRLLQKWKSMSPRQQNFVRGILDFEIDFSEDHTDTDDYITVFVPTGSMEDGMLYDSSHFYKINAASYRKKFGDDLYCGIQITSDHLHPAYHYGDILLICKKAIHEGDTGIFLNKDTGRVYVRRLAASSPWVLEPVNNLGRPIIIDREEEAAFNIWIRFGYVLTKIRT